MELKKSRWTFLESHSHHGLSLLTNQLYLFAGKHVVLLSFVFVLTAMSLMFYLFYYYKSTLFICSFYLTLRGPVCRLI